MTSLVAKVNKLPPEQIRRQFDEIAAQNPVLANLREVTRPSMLKRIGNVINKLYIHPASQAYQILGQSGILRAFRGFMDSLSGFLTGTRTSAVKNVPHQGIRNSGQRLSQDEVDQRFWELIKRDPELARYDQELIGTIKRYLDEREKRNEELTLGAR